MADIERIPTPIPAHRVAGLPAPDIEVPAGRSREIGPFADDPGPFHLVAIEAFDDLKLLGLIPEDLDESDARHAVSADSRERRLQRDAAGDCHCHDGSAGSGGSTGRTWRRSNVHLIELLQPRWGVELHDEHPVVMHTRAHLRRYVTRRISLIGLVAARDINVGDHATLTISPSTTVLNANDINIGDEGRLRFRGTGVKVRCSTLNGPRPISPNAVALRSHSWLLDREGLAP